MQLKSLLFPFILHALATCELVEYIRPKMTLGLGQLHKWLDSERQEISLELLSLLLRE